MEAMGGFVGGSTDEVAAVGGASVDGWRYLRTTLSATSAPQLTTSRPSWVFRLVNEWRWARYERRARVELASVVGPVVEVQAAAIREVAGRAGRVERSPGGGVWGVS